MDTQKLDALVTNHLADRLFKPERLTAMLTSLARRRATKAAAVHDRLNVLEKEAHETNERLRRLYKLGGMASRRWTNYSGIGSNP